jgi:uncharacterized protein YjcR
MNTLRELFIRLQIALGVRGHTLIAKSIAGIEKTVAKLEQGIVHIDEDAKTILAKLEANRVKHAEKQTALYDEHDALQASSARAARVAARFSGLVQ